MRQMILNRTPFFGNDDPYADQIAVRVFDDLYDAHRGQAEYERGVFPFEYVIHHLPCLLRQGDGNHPERPLGRACDLRWYLALARSRYPRAVRRCQVLGKLDQVKSGGTLLNQRFLPSLLRREEDISKLASLIRSYFALGGHHIQFNIVDTETLYAAQKCPEDYRDLLVRVAGYSDYFNDMNADLQADVIARTEQETF